MPRFRQRFRTVWVAAACLTYAASISAQAATRSPAAMFSGMDFTAALRGTAIAGQALQGIAGDLPCSSYPYGTTVIPGTVWASALGVTAAADGANLDVKSNWDGSSCVRGQDPADTWDAWGLDYQCTQLAVRAADVEWNEGSANTWFQAGWNGNAYNMFDIAPRLPVPLLAVSNGTGLLPNPGDLLVWNQTSADPTGHVAVVERVDTTNHMVWFVSQNSYYAEYGIPYNGTTLDPAGQFGLPLRGWVDFPRPARGIVQQPNGLGGYMLDGWGGVHPFGGAPSVTDAPFWPNWDIARSIVLRGDGVSGYMLDGWGGVHPFGGAPSVSVTAYWPGWDIARSMVLRPDGASGYVLDGWGGIHPFGGAPPVLVTAYWRGWDIARSMVLRPDGASGYVLDGWGGMHPFGAAPPVAVSGYWRGWDIARSLVLAGDGTNPRFPLNSGWVLDGWGGLHAFGGAPAALFLADPYHPGVDDARGAAFAPVVNRGVTLNANSPPAPFGADIPPSRGVALRSTGAGGYVLDGWGGITPFGGAPPLSGGPSWTGWDIARGFVLRPDGSSGYEVDGWGGVHPFGGAPSVTVAGYWPGQDLARGIVLLPGGASGYVLDEHGGLWPFGGAPSVSVSATWTTDSARAVVMRLDGIGGYVLDEYGAVHPFGGAPPLSTGVNWGSDFARAVALLTDTSGYVLDAWGGIHPFGGAPPVSGYGYWPGLDIARSLVVAPASSTGVTGVDVISAGTLFPFAD